MLVTVYQLICFFFIYGFLGWCLEVCYQALCNGALVNRGFLNGALCPIYGFGAVLVIWLLGSSALHGIFLFAGSVFLCSVLEGATGLMLEKLFHQKWWDYSQERFNLGGYICLKYSILWGLACVFTAEIIHPTFTTLVSLIPHTVGIVLLSIISACFFIDCAATLKTLAGFNKELRRIDESAARLRKVSDDITEALYESAIRAKGEAERARAEASEVRARTRAEAEKKLIEASKKELGRKLTYGQRRLLRAFPGVISTRYLDAMEDMKKRLNAYVKHK